MRLMGKDAIVAGGGTGIGRTIAMRLAREGARVAILGVSEEAGRAAAEEIGGVFVPCDISDVTQVRTAVSGIVDRFGGLDILVVNAAHTGGHFDAVAMPVDVWRQGLAVSLDGAFYCAREAVPAMVKRGGGSLVLISSVEGMKGARQHAAYVTAKSALFGLTRSMAIDFGHLGIRVNAISPGIIDSGRPDIDAAKHDPRWRAFWRDMTVLGRMGTSEDVAAAVVFLASDEASYITGQNLAVDGGWTIGHAPFPDASEPEQERIEGHG